jgi:CheY-like chemotaxis protein
MAKNVLIVDDEMEMLWVIKKVFIQYRDIFNVLLAEDGEVALEMLKENEVALVITDLIMPRMDGFSLLIHIMSDYPTIPVIIMTAHSKPAMERMARKIGVMEYIEKPFDMEELAQQIIALLTTSPDEYELKTMSMGRFLYLIGLEQKTCTIQVLQKSTDRRGALFFLDGVLIDAELAEKNGEPAALEILSWDNVVLSKQDDCERTERRIHREMPAILEEIPGVHERKPGR